MSVFMVNKIQATAMVNGYVDFTNSKFSFDNWNYITNGAAWIMSSKMISASVIYYWG